MTTEAEFNLIEVPATGTTAIFEANTLQCWFEGVRADAEKAADLWKGMLVAKPQGKRKALSNKRRSITLEASYACNLRCRYCFMSDDPEYCENHRHMSFETARRYFLKHHHPKTVEHLSVSFLGGEPSLNMDLVCRVVEWAARNYTKATFSMTTNGTLLSKPLREAVTFELNPKLGNMSIGEWMARRNFGMTLSCDGPREAHDAMRVHGDGRGSFDEMTGAIKALCLTPATRWVRRFTFRATYGDDLSVSILDRLKFFNVAIASGIGGNVHLEPAALKAETLPIVEAQYIEATEWFISMIKGGFSPPKWSDLTKILAKLVHRNPSAHNCGAGINYMTLGVDGQIYACHRTLGAEVGTLQGGVDSEAMAEWEDNRVYSLPDCKDCESKYICGGGCRAANFAENGSTHIPATTNCFVRNVRLRCALRMIEALTPEELARVCPQPDNKKSKPQEKKP